MESRSILSFDFFFIVRASSRNAMTFTISSG
jgi:hypothetical protein